MPDEHDASAQSARVTRHSCCACLALDSIIMAAKDVVGLEVESSDPPELQSARAAAARYLTRLFGGEETSATAPLPKVDFDALRPPRE